MNINFRIWRMDPFGPSKKDGDAGVIFGGLGDFFKLFMSPQSTEKEDNNSSEDVSNVNELREAAYDELWNWLRKESYNTEYEVYHAPYFVNEAFEKWKKR